MTDPRRRGSFLLNGRFNRTLFLLGLPIASISALLLSARYLLRPLPLEDLVLNRIAAVSITDRHGRLLRRVLSSEYGISEPVPYEKIPRDLVSAFLTAEDKRFFRHRGFDISATARALIQNLRAGRTVSGASTISQQVINNIHHMGRSKKEKAKKILLALRLERTLSKNDILEQYLNRILFGNNQFGIASAADYYFSKKTGDLSLSESAFLASIPKSPEQYNPLRRPERLEERRKHLLVKMSARGLITPQAFSNAWQNPPRLRRQDQPFFAPHFCDRVLRLLASSGRLGSITEVRTTLDLDLYREALRIMRRRIRELKLYNVSNSALLVLDNRTGDVLVMIGSRDYRDPAIDGQYNAVYARRQPGSAIKPFTYALALMNGFTPASVLPDIETRFPDRSRSFIPRNYDRTFNGPVLLRRSLSCSLNVATVWLLNELGVRELHGLLRRAGIVSLTREPEFYGLGLTLGNGDLSLLELVRANTAFPLGGTPREERLILSVKTTGGKVLPSPPGKLRERIFNPEVAFLISDILADNDSRVASFGDDSFLHLPFPAAVKTGTTKNYRDNWTVGFNKSVTAGVWVGNFNNSPMFAVSGISGAGPIWHDLMLELVKKGYGGWVDRPAGLVRTEICGLSGKKPGPYCTETAPEYFLRGTEPDEPCSFHRDARHLWLPPLYHHWAEENRINDYRPGEPDPSGPRARIIYPRDKSRFTIDPVLRRESQDLKFRLEINAPFRDVRWILDGQEKEKNADEHSLFWNLLPGPHTIFCRILFDDGWFATETVSFTVH